MDLCIVSPKFHPAIGGTETYLENIVKFCSKTLETIVITSNLVGEIAFFEKREYIKKRHDIISNNVKIIRSKTLHNKLLRSSLYFNEFLNQRIERIIDKLKNPKRQIESIYNYRRSQKLNNIILRSLIYQKSFKNPYCSHLNYILKKIHNNHKIKIIHSAPIYSTTNIRAFCFSKKKNIPFICTPSFHINPYDNNFFYPSYQFILKHSEAIIAETRLEREFYSRYGINKKKISVIPPAINPIDYKKPNVEKFKKNLNIPKDNLLLLYMGRRKYYKGVQNAIYALNYLIKKFKNIKLIIAGPKTREYLLFFKKLPSDLKSHIIDLGVISNDTKSDVLASCDIFLMPSLEDAFGIVYLEAWLFKKPVIGAAEGNVSDVIDNGVNGFIIPFNDIKKLIQKIEILLKDPKMREEFGQNGYNKLIKNNLLEKTNRKILELYEKFL